MRNSQNFLVGIERDDRFQNVSFALSIYQCSSRNLQSYSYTVSRGAVLHSVVRRNKFESIWQRISYINIRTGISDANYSKRQKLLCPVNLNSFAKVSKTVILKKCVATVLR